MCFLNTDMNKWFLFIIWLLTLYQSQSQPLPTSTNLAAVDIDINSVDEFQYFADVTGQGNQRFVSTILIPLSGVEFLRVSRLDPFFGEGAKIDFSTIIYTNSNGNNIVPFTSYIARRDRETGIWTFQDGGLTVGARDRLEAIFGLRFTREGSVYHGWARFTRPDSRPETLFTVAGHDWNPVPDAPIRAGQPPEIPMAAEVLPDGTGLRLTWPPSISNWILESTPSLSPPAEWATYPAGGTYADVPPEAADRYFRLRRPE